MAWLTDLTHLPHALRRITNLLQEQNQLLRELIQAQTGRSAATRPTVNYPTPPRRLTDRDVSHVTRKSTAEVQQRQKREQFLRDRGDLAAPVAQAAMDPLTQPFSYPWRLTPDSLPTPSVGLVPAAPTGQNANQDPDAADEPSPR